MTDAEEWTVQFANVEELDKMEAELKRAFVASLSPKERLEGLSPQEMLQGLSPEERRRLKQLLEQQENGAPEEQ